MKSERIYIDEEKLSYFDTYILERSSELKPGFKRPAVLVCPGGGYQYTSDREGEPIALAFNAMGYHAFVLRYGVDKRAVFPKPLKDISKTMEYIKTHSGEWDVNPNKIFVQGGSAGGHLAASLGVCWNNKEYFPEYEGREELIRPAGMILAYPVIDLKCTTTGLDVGFGDVDIGSCDFAYDEGAVKKSDVLYKKDGRVLINFEVHMNAYMFGGYATDEQIEKYSVNRHVTADSVPAFIWHSSRDDLIFPTNSMLLTKALMDNNVPVELHMFDAGGHGMALSNEVTANNFWEIDDRCEKWLSLASLWMRDMTKEDK